MNLYLSLYNAELLSSRTKAVISGSTDGLDAGEIRDAQEVRAVNSHRAALRALRLHPDLKNKKYLKLLCELVSPSANNAQSYKFALAYCSNDSWFVDGVTVHNLSGSMPDFSGSFNVGGEEQWVVMFSEGKAEWIVGENIVIVNKDEGVAGYIYSLDEIIAASLPKFEEQLEQVKNIREIRRQEKLFKEVQAEKIREIRCQEKLLKDQEKRLKEEAIRFREVKKNVVLVDRKSVV